MKRSTMIAILVGVCAMVSAAYAQDKTPVVDQREQHQQQRIEQGVKSGELTNGETLRLEKQQAKIKTDEMKMKSDGKVTPRERAKLKREQNRASRNIYRKKHNVRNKN